MKIGLLNKLKERLPVNPGILRKNEFFNSAVLIPLVHVSDEYFFLFEKRAADIRQGGEICFPGGEIDETDSDIIHTAVRETVEELGVDKNKIEIVGRLDTLVGPMRVTVDSVVAILKIDDISNIPFDKREVEKIFLLPISFFEKTPPEKYKLQLQAHSTIKDKSGNEIELFPAKELKLPERYQKPWNAGNSTVLVYRTGEGTIWGITASLVYELVRKLC
ncbi:MAG: CoA pyrophosphatase [Ignavibacteriaceae bacterium]|nr:CoA pyrophosphatase [Ignavibacteriaceae bacterium]